MMMRQPAEFARVARQWAVRYAGAPPKPDEVNLDVSAGGQDATEEDNLARYDICEHISKLLIESELIFYI